MKTIALSIAALIIVCRPEIGRAQSLFAPTDSIGQIHDNALNLDRPDSQRNKLCFRTQGCPDCDTAILLEFNLAKSQTDNESAYGGGEFGILKNVSKAWGVGGTVFYGSSDYGGRFGLRARARRWLGPKIGLEMGPGIILARSGNQGAIPGFSGQVALDLYGVVAPMYQLDMIPNPNGNGAIWESLVGVRTESYAAPIVASGLVALFLATFNSSLY